MNKLDKKYTDLLQDILDNGNVKKDRTGTGTISVFGREIRHKMSEGFPLLTTKKMFFKGVVTELIWFLRGDTNIRYLVDNDCHIWDGDAYKNYLKNFMLPACPASLDVIPDFYEPMSMEMFIKSIQEKNSRGDEFAKKWGDLGPVYGKQWRNWVDDNFYKHVTSFDRKSDQPKIEHEVKRIDQIADLIHDLKNNPDSRRLMVTAWNPADVPNQVLPPCHYGFQCYTRELNFEERLNYLPKKDSQMVIDWCENPSDEILKGFLDAALVANNIPIRTLSLKWNQRSVDTFLGLPFNIASYGLLLEILAKTVNMVPDELIGTLGDTHLYLNHIEQAKEQIGRDYSYSERFNILKEKVGPMGLNHDRIEEEVLASTPARTREPFGLPKLIHGKTDDFYKSLSDSLSLFGHLDPKDFKIEGYQSHPTIKASLSN